MLLGRRGHYLQGDGEINALFSGIKGAQTPPPPGGSIDYNVVVVCRSAPSLICRCTPSSHKTGRSFTTRLTGNMPGYKNGLLFTTTSMLAQYQQGVVAYLSGEESRSAWRKPTASLYRTEKNV